MEELDTPPPPRLTHEIITPGDGSVVIVLDGELDLATTNQLNAAVQDAIASVSTCLVVDAERLLFADSSAIALWVNWSSRVPKIEIRNPRLIVRRVIDMMGLTATLNPS
jgi:anti-anti-sigma factor